MESGQDVGRRPIMGGLETKRWHCRLVAERRDGEGVLRGRMREGLLGVVSVRVWVMRPRNPKEGR